MKPNPNEHDPWWRLSGRTWCLLALGAIASLACSFEPAPIEKTIWLFDFRQWPIWYFVPITVVFMFSLRWYAICRKSYETGRDGPERLEERGFVRVTVIVSVLMFLAVVFHRLGLFQLFL